MGVRMDPKEIYRQDAGQWLVCLGSRSCLLVQLVPYLLYAEGLILDEVLGGSLTAGIS